MSSISADTLLYHARVITGEPWQLPVQAIAIKEGKVLWLGSDSDARQLRSKTTLTIDCLGKTLVPGFIDAHCHILAQVRNLFSLDLNPAQIRSISDIQETLRRKSRFTPPGRWISGMDYNEFYLAEKRHPTRFDLDAVSPQNPVMLVHRSLHACVLNSLALDLVGIDIQSEEPEGGLIERDLETGQPNGVLYEMLDYLNARIDFSLSEEELKWGIGEVNRTNLSLGITSLVDATATNDFERWQTFQGLKSRLLQSRLNMMFGIHSLSNFSEAGLSFGSGDENLRLGSIKIVLSETRGQLQPSQSALNSLALEASQRGFQLAFHAVEESSLESALLALEFTGRGSPTGSLRHRIEHCSVCPPHLLRRLKRLQAVVVSQPPFLYFSGERYLAQLPPGVFPWLYPFKSWLEAGITVAGSSDSPVAPPNPLIGIYAAVTRRAESGGVVWGAEAVSAEQALRMYTLSAAYATFEEKIKGSLAVGKLADLVLLSSDPLSTPPEEIKEIEVEMTLIGGKVVFVSSG